MDLPNLWVIAFFGFFGLAFFLAGISFMRNGIRVVWRWMRMRREGVTVEADIVERRFIQDHKAEAPPAHFGTLRWGYGSGYHTSELKIPEKW